VGVGSEHLLENGHSILVEDLRYPAFGIPDIAEYQRFGRAGLHTSRLQSRIDAVDAEVALFDHTRNRVDIPGIIGAGRPTIVTTDTSVGIDEHNAVFPPVGRVHGTDRIANGPLTLVTHPGQEERTYMGIHSLFDGLHPGFPDSQGDLVFGFTGDGTAVTPDTKAQVNHHSPPYL